MSHNSHITESVYNKKNSTSSKGSSKNITSNAIEITNLSKSFSTSKPILQNLNLLIPKNSILGLVALNGMGKTTLIKLILNIIFPDSGEIKIFNKSSNSSQSRSSVFYLPEKFSPSSNLTCIQTIQIISKLYRTLPTINEISETINQVDLDEKYLNKKISTLSKGTVQKIALAIYALSQRKLLIFDEPMNGLDIKAKDILKSTIYSYHKKHNATFIITSHILQDISEICTHYAFLHNGHITHYNTTDSLKLSNQNLEEHFRNSILTTNNTKS